MKDPNRLQAVTWNVYHGSTKDDLWALSSGEMGKGSELWYLQEAGAQFLPSMLKGLGLATTQRDQFLTAWDPKQYTLVGESQLIELSTASWLTRGGEQAHSQALRTILCDRWGRSVETVNYHLPAHVQPEGTAGREAASRQSAQALGDLARDSVATGFLAAGDDNVYEQGAGDFRYLMESETGLRQIQAEEGTFGKRPIDDFRLPREGDLRYVRGSSSTSPGTDAEKPSHDRHRASFRWVGERTVAS